MVKGESALLRFRIITISATLVILVSLILSCTSPGETPGLPPEEDESAKEDPKITFGNGGAPFIEPFEAPLEPIPVLEATLRRNPDGPDVVTNPSCTLVLVNKDRNLPEDFVPANLVQPSVPFPFEGDLPRKRMRQDAAQALESLVATAAEEGITLYGSSGYRSYQTQAQIFEANVRRRGEEEANRFSARPGQSEHQTGLAMDVTSPEVGFTLTQQFGATPAGRWLAENAHHFGFIIRYPEGAEDITGYAYEPWHLRYLGEEHARAIYEADITFEEYMEGR